MWGEQAIEQCERMMGWADFRLLWVAVPIVIFRTLLIYFLAVAFSSIFERKATIYGLNHPLFSLQNLPHLESLNISGTEVCDLSALEDLRHSLKSLFVYRLNFQEKLDPLPVLHSLDLLQVLWKFFSVRSRMRNVTI